MNEYQLISNFIIETPPDTNLHQQLLEELTYALIDIIERHGCYCGGGFQIKEHQDE